MKAFSSEEFLPLLWRTAAALIGLLVGLGAIWLCASGVLEFGTKGMFE